MSIPTATAKTVIDWKRAASAGIFDGFIPAFPSLRILAVSEGDF
jgi:hypothetical protein